MRPFINGVTLIMWAWATWWVPLLVLFGVWKHGVRRVPLRYTPMLWSFVFPLGMYALASLRLSLAADFPVAADFRCHGLGGAQRLDDDGGWVAFVVEV